MKCDPRRVYGLVLAVLSPLMSPVYAAEEKQAKADEGTKFLALLKMAKTVESSKSPSRLTRMIKA